MIRFKVNVTGELFIPIKAHQYIRTVAAILITSGVVLEWGHKYCFHSLRNLFGNSIMSSCFFRFEI